MTAGPTRVLVADGRLTVRSAVTPLLRRSGFDVVTVASSLDVLRTLRDQSVELLLIDPDLPGGGVSGVDAVRTLKSATRFRGLPAFFLTTGSQRPPEGVADGALQFDTLTEQTLLDAVRRARGAPPTGDAGLDDGGDGLRAAVASVCREELRAAVLQVVREVAQETVPVIAERLIREEIARLRARHGLESGTTA